MFFNKTIITAALLLDIMIIKRLTSYEDILFAITKNGLALQYIREDKINELKIDKYKVIILAAVTQNGLAYKYIQKAMFSTFMDFNIILTAVTQNGLALENIANTDYENDELYQTIVVAAVVQNGLALEYLNLTWDNIENYKHIILTAVIQNGLAVKYLHSYLTSNNIENYKHIILNAVEQNGLALEYIYSFLNIQTHTTIILAAVTQNGLALKYVTSISVVVQEIYAFILAAIKQNGLVLGHLKDNNEIKKDKVIILAAVTQNGLALQYITEDEIKKNGDIMLAAVEQNGLALQYITEDEIKKDKVIMLAAVKQNGLALQYITEDEIKKNEVIMLAAVKQNGLALQYITKDENILKTIDIINIILVSVKQNILALEYVKEEQIILLLLKLTNPNDNAIILCILKNISSDTINKIRENYPTLLNNFDINIVRDAIEQNGLLLSLVIEIFISNIHLIKRAIKQNSNTIYYIDNKELIAVITMCDSDDDESILLDIFTSKPCILMNTPHNTLNRKFKNNIAFAIKAIKQNPDYYYYSLIPEYKGIRKIIRELLNIDTSYYANIPENRQKDAEIKTFTINKNIKNNNLYATQKINIFHIGYMELDTTDTEKYISYSFISAKDENNVDIINEMNKFMTSIDKIIYQSNGYHYTNNYILITLDGFSYVQYLNTDKIIRRCSASATPHHNITSPYEIVDHEKYNENECSNITITTNTMLKSKLDKLYELIKEVLSNETQFRNINILNISNSNDLTNSNKYREIINILLHKYNKQNTHKTKKYIINEIYYKTILFSNMTKLENTKLLSHWINNLFITPSILQRRQQQFGGTCVTNAIFNALFLVDDIKKVLLRKYDDNHDIDKDIFITTEDDLTKYEIVKDGESIFYYIIGNIIHNIKHKNPKLEYMIILAAYVRNSIHSREINSFKDNIRKLLTPNEYEKVMKEPFFKICSADDNNRYREMLCALPRAVPDSEHLKELNSICNYTASFRLNKKNICDTTTDINEKYGYIYGEYGVPETILTFLNIIFKQPDDEAMDSFVRSMWEKNKPSELIIDDDDINILLIYCDEIQNEDLKVTETRHCNKYLLQSCILYTAGHMICGIKNYRKEGNSDADYYVYDSNNIYSTDDWSKLLKKDTPNIIFNELDDKRRKRSNLFTLHRVFTPVFFIYTYRKKQNQRFSPACNEY